MLDQAEPFLAEVEAKALKAAEIAYLPQYMDQRLRRLAETIRRRDSARDSIAGIRKNIPQDAIEAERQAGRQSAFSLELVPCHIRKHDDFFEAVGKIRYATGGTRYPWDTTEEEEAEQESLVLV